MFLYTTENIYAVFPPERRADITTRPVRGGYAELEDSAQGPRMLRIISTDPGVYLELPGPGELFGTEPKGRARRRNG